mmetsp:Transcript_16556/g.21477  ORF Transcript_16556/g.21477 Transcript_16556/m.21477 type:complete len:85 (+) Transcript_16556:647-901(+)
MDGTGVASAMETIASLAINQQIRRNSDLKHVRVKQKKTVDLRKSEDPAMLYERRSKCASCGGGTGTSSRSSRKSESRPPHYSKN